IFHCLRLRCARRNRCYSNEISSHHTRYCSSGGGFSSLRGHGSFFCGREGSVIYSRGASPCQPMPASSTCRVSGGYRCGGDGSVVITGDSGGTSGWGMAGGTVPVYGTEGEIGCSSEDSGQNISIISGRGGGSSCHSGSLGTTEGGGSGYGYDASPREKALTTGWGSGGSGYCSGGSGYGIGQSSQAIQQKCPVVIPNIKNHQSKQTSHWPPIQKK
ncbi:PREDICTED: loricrin-like, partial [Eurypyga helias]|uniref:loricrin-like n=1 Tax=Eurypyga helias TaxID=54383 RepID=UPI000528C211